MNGEPTLGQQLRSWRERRRLSQMDLAGGAKLSPRHLSFVETGRSRPSRETVLRLADALELPLRNRNALLMAAGYAPAYPDRHFGDLAFAQVRALVQRILDAHMPFPALAVNGHWELLASNAAVSPLLKGVAAELLAPPVNVLKLSLHPGGLAARISNLAEWKSHVVERLRHQLAASGDPTLERLLQELRDYPAPASALPLRNRTEGRLAVPMLLDSPVGQLSLLSMTTVFGTPVDVTLSELAIETFLPADEDTAERLRTLASDA